MEFQSPRTGGTRGGALDAEDRIKHQAVIVYWKKRAQGVPAMKAYQEAGELTNCSLDSVRSYVRAEKSAGIDGLSSKRANCGMETRFSPGKKRKIDEMMEETDGEVTLREAREVPKLARDGVLGVTGSWEDAAALGGISAVLDCGWGADCKAASVFVAAPRRYCNPAWRPRPEAPPKITCMSNGGKAKRCAPRAGIIRG